MDDNMDEYKAFQDAFRLRLTQWAAGFMAIFIATATVIRPWFVEMSPAFTYLGIFNALATAVVYVLIVSNRFVRGADFLLALVMLGLCLPLIVISGGVNSQFTYLLPLYPIVCTLVAGRHKALYLACLMVVSVLLLHLLAGQFMDLTGEVPHPAKTVSRTIWLLLALALSMLFSWQFDLMLSHLQRELRRQATRDPLTGLANRRAMAEFLERERARAGRTGGAISLLLIDVDYFKQYNDRHGHAAGDRCLKQVARVLRQGIRSGQDLAVRYGGEEFVVILPDTDIRGAHRAAEHIRQSIAGMPPIVGTDESITVTIGCIAADAICATATMFSHADSALYRGKASGRNRVVLA